MRRRPGKGKAANGADLLKVLNLHAALVDKGHPLLSQQAAAIHLQNVLDLGISFHHQGLGLPQPVLARIQYLLVILCTTRLAQMQLQHTAQLALFAEQHANQTCAA